MLGRERVRVRNTYIHVCGGTKMWTLAGVVLVSSLQSSSSSE